MREKTFDKVKDFVKENEMLARNCAVIAGVSGGNDSMTMLHLLRRLREIWHFHLRVVHVNHGIRGAEADRDQRMVETVCTESNIPCSVYRYDVPELSVKWKLGTEETGRIVRRQAFDAETHKCRKQYAVVRTALAHNKNDLAETMLHHLARGTGLRGLCSLKPVNGEVIRPLLCLERREIDDYIRECGIPSVLDSTNLEDEYTRNRIRRHLLPVMEREINAKTVEHMAETSRLLSEAEEFLTDEAAQLAADYREPDGSYFCSLIIFSEKTDPQKLWSPDDPRKTERPQPGSHTDAYPAGTGTLFLPGEQADFASIWTGGCADLRWSDPQEENTAETGNRRAKGTGNSPSSHIGRGGNTVWPVYDQSFFLFRREDFRKKVYEMV